MNYEHPRIVTLEEVLAWREREAELAQKSLELDQEILSMKKEAKKRQRALGNSFPFYIKDGYVELYKKEKPLKE
jgi:hypothetical protein